MSYILGCDLSIWNGVTNYAKMKSAGIQFAFVKSTQGASITDPRALEHIRGLRDMGISWGIYHFVDDVDAVPQMNNLLDFVGQLANVTNEIPLGIMLDLEIKLTKTTWPVLNTALLGLFGARYRLGVYTNNNTWNLNGNPPEPGIGRWVANYKYHNSIYWQVGNYRDTIERCKTQKPVLPKNWSGWEYWQFTGDMAPGSEFGVSSKTIDLNFYSGDLEDLYPPVIDPNARITALEKRIDSLVEALNQLTYKASELEKSQALLKHRVDGIQVGLRQAGNADW